MTSSPDGAGFGADGDATRVTGSGACADPRRSAVHRSASIRRSPARAAPGAQWLLFPAWPWPPGPQVPRHDARPPDPDSFDSMPTMARDRADMDMPFEATSSARPSRMKPDSDSIEDLATAVSPQAGPHRG